MLRGCLGTAAPAIDCQLLLAAARDEKCEEGGDSGFGKTNAEPVASTAMEDVNKNVPVSGEGDLASSAPCNGGLLEPPPKRRRLMTSFRCSFRRARLEWRALMAEGVVKVRKRVIGRVGDDIIRSALDFIFRHDNVQLISWGTKRIRRGACVVEFPAVLHLKSQVQIFRDYETFVWANSDSGEQRVLGRTRFLNLVNMFTKGQLERKSSVDYVIGVLLYDNYTTLETIIKKEVHDVTIRNALCTKLIAVTDFINFGTRNYIGKDGDCLHDVNFAVLSGNVGRSGTAVVLKCGYCLAPFRLVNRIRRFIQRDIPCMGAVLDDATNKLHLLHAHILRCTMQERRIRRV